MRTLKKLLIVIALGVFMTGIGQSTDPGENSIDLLSVSDLSVASIDMDGYEMRLSVYEGQIGHADNNIYANWVNRLENSGYVDCVPGREFVFRERPSETTERLDRVERMLEDIYRHLKIEEPRECQPFPPTD